MSLVLVAAYGADRRRIDYARVSPFDVAMNFIATFQPTPGAAIDPARVLMVHALDWMPSASVDHDANQVTFQIDHAKLVFAGIMDWEGLICEINRRYDGETA